MDREIVGNNPEMGMTFMYHRSDGLWLFKVSVIDDQYVTYDYTFYKGRRARNQVTIDELEYYAEYESQTGWCRGSSNSRSRWKDLIIGGGTHGGNVRRVILLNHYIEPAWEV